MAAGRDLLRRSAVRLVPVPRVTSAAHGARWGAAAGLIEQLLSTAATLVLVRIFAPAEFGLVAAATVVVNLISVVTNVGFSGMIIKKDGLTRRATDTLFSAATVLGLAIAALGSVGAPLLAAGVGTPDAAPYLAGLCPALAARTVSALPRAMLQRRGHFRAMYWNQIRNSITYVSVTLVLALGGAGVWAVVIGQVVAAVTSLLTLLVLARYRPRWAWDTRLLKEMRSLAQLSLMLVFATYIVRNADYWAVGQAAGASALGVYYVAYVLPNILRARLTSSVGDVLFPMMVRLADDDVALRDRYARSLSGLILLGAPLMVGVAMTSRQTVEVFFGTTWAAAARPMAILALVALIEFAVQVANPTLMAKSDFKSVLRAQWVRVSVLLVLLGLVPLVEDPLRAAAGANALSTAVIAVYYTRRLRHLIGLTYGVVWRSVRGPVLAATMMSLGLAALSRGLGGAVTPPVELIALVCGGAIIYVAAIATVLNRWSRDGLLLLHDMVPSRLQGGFRRLLLEQDRTA